MKPLANPRTLLSIFLLALFLCPLPLGAEEVAKGPTKAPQCAKMEQPTVPTADEQPTENLQTLRQRYGHDPTGVRARIGMCRRGHGGGYGNGRGEGHGRGRGAIRDHHRPCPSQNSPWKKP